MITSLLNSGFGHAVRFIAMVESIRKNSNIPISCLVSGSTEKFISLNTSKYNCHVYNIYYYDSLVKNNMKTRRYISTGHKKALDKLYATSIMINDFFTNTSNIQKLFSKDAITCCLYHGDLNIYEEDDQKIKSFKKSVCRTASQHDIFFHINIEQPVCMPYIKCIYIPIPIITRQVSMDKNTVNKILGLSPSDKFILIHAGSAVMENVYSSLYEFYTAVNHLKTDYRIVVSNSLENNGFPFRRHIIKAPLFNNGIDLVNASELVVSKPGMGILQDCIAAKKPLLFLPGDFPERSLKISLLDKLLGSKLPLLRKISSSELKECIDECLNIANLYNTAYEKVYINGADVMARSMELIKDAKSGNINDYISELYKITPFIACE